MRDLTGLQVGHGRWPATIPRGYDTDARGSPDSGSRKRPVSLRSGGRNRHPNQGWPAAVAARRPHVNARIAVSLVRPALVGACSAPDLRPNFPLCRVLLVARPRAKYVLDLPAPRPNRRCAPEGRARRPSGACSGSRTWSQHWQARRARPQSGAPRPVWGRHHRGRHAPRPAAVASTGARTAPSTDAAAAAGRSAPAQPADLRPVVPGQGGHQPSLSTSHEPFNASSVVVRLHPPSRPGWPAAPASRR